MDPSNRSYLLNTAVFHFYIEISTFIDLFDMFVKQILPNIHINTPPKSLFYLIDLTSNSASLKP